jgi:hypothetical protein
VLKPDRRGGKRVRAFPAPRPWRASARNRLATDFS